MAKVSKNRTSKKELSSSFDISVIISLILRNWYWFIISLAICLTYGYVYIEQQIPVFQTHTVLRVKNTENSAKQQYLGMAEIQGI